jgi:transketolase
MAKATRVAFGEALKRLGETHDRIVVLDADLSCSTMTKKFADAFPDRFFQIGIAEGNMVGIAAGMALGGMVPFAASFACFVTGRFEQIRMSIGYNNANVTVVGTHAGIGIGEDGYSQMGLEDIAVMRSLPNMVVVQPADSVETERATEFLADYVGPAYLRLTRQPVPDIYDRSYRFDFGQGVVLREGQDLTIVATGGVVAFALEAAKMLEREGLHVGVVDMHTIKPIDAVLLRKVAVKTGRILTVEDHGVVGGLGSSVLEVLADVPDVIVQVHGVRGYGESGTHQELYERHRLDAGGIATVAKEWLWAKKPVKAAG